MGVQRFDALTYSMRLLELASNTIPVPVLPVPVQETSSPEIREFVTLRSHSAASGMPAMWKESAVRFRSETPVNHAPFRLLLRSLSRNVLPTPRFSRASRAKPPAPVRV